MTNAEPYAEVCPDIFVVSVCVSSCMSVMCARFFD